MESNQGNRESFATKFGVIAATAGSAVGLGNIWRFPYLVGENGGAAFLLVYLGFVLMIGIPVMLSEFIIGRKARKNRATLGFSAFVQKPRKNTVFRSFLAEVPVSWSFVATYSGASLRRANSIVAPTQAR